jgi:hypothetical protein
VGDFHKLIANVREALERHDVPAHNGAAGSATTVPRTEAARRVELASQFARELQALGGHFLGTLSPRETSARIVEIAIALASSTMPRRSPPRSNAPA